MECVGGGEKSACWQCRHVKAKCSLVGKRGVAPTTPAKPRKRARTGEAGTSKVGGRQEVAEKESEVTAKGDEWGARACEALARLSGSLDGLTTMVERQNAILGRLAVRMEEESDWARWRRRREGEPAGPPAVIMGAGDEEEDDEVEGGAENEGENEEEEEVGNE